MLYKTTLKLLLVETPFKSLLLPIVSNSYKKTLWLLKHREPLAEVVGIIEGPYEDINFMHVGEVNTATLHNQILRTTTALYISIGKQPQLPEVFTLDYSLTLEDFIIKYSKMFTPDELLIVLGVKHSKLFKVTAKLVVDNTITYVPENGPNKWSYYDYFWLHERYKHKVLLDIRPFINRSLSQIKFRASDRGLTRKIKKRIVTNVTVSKQEATEGICLCGRPVVVDKECKTCNTIQLTEVMRDYMISQINDVVYTTLNKG